MITEAVTCRMYVVPRLQEAGWEEEPHSLRSKGRLRPAASSSQGMRRRDGKRADYILRYTRDFPIAVIEAKPLYKTPAAGLQQAKEYALILGLNSQTRQRHRHRRARFPHWR